MESSPWRAILLILVEALVGLAVWYLKKRYERKWAKEDAAPPTPPAPAPTAPGAVTAAAPTSAPVPPGGLGREVRFISHSTLFYWWPIWFLGFIFAGLTYWDGNRVAVVPGGTKVEATGTPDRYTLVLPSTDAPTSLKEAERRSAAGQEAYPMHGAEIGRWHGPVFFTVLVMVILFTNLPLRGVWSLVLLLAMLAAALGLAALGGWDSVLESMKSVQIQMNTTGYVFIASSVFAFWVITVFITDQQRYLIVTPTEIRLRTGYRPREVRFSTAGVVFDKAQDDLFLHQVLGFAAGDLIVRTPDGAEFYLPNVMWLEMQMERIRQLLGPDAVAK